MRIQSLCVDATTDLSYTGSKLNNISTVKAMIFRVCGACFLQHIAICYKNKIVIYDIIESQIDKFFKNDNISEEIPFYRNVTMDMLEGKDTWPTRIAVETTDIEVIRELIARGKKLSWFSSDLEFGGNFPGLFDFEHLFLNHFAGEGIMLPDGVKRKIRTRRYKKNFTYPFDAEKHIFFSMKYYRFDLLGGLWRQIGFYPKKFLCYVDRYYMIKQRMRLREEGKTNYYVTHKTDLLFNNQGMQISILNILSITYMVWKKSNCVTIVKKRTVKKESKVEYVPSKQKPVSFAKV